MKRRICIVLLVAILLTFVTACSSGDEWENMLQVAEKMGDKLEDSQVRQSAQQMLDAVLADNFDDAYRLVANVITEAEFRQAYADIRLVLDGVEEYTLIPSYKTVNTNNGATTVVIRYMLIAGGKRIFVDATCVQGSEGLYGFWVHQYVPVTQTGTLTSMKGANLAQWVLLAVGVLGMAFVAWMFIDCCRHKMKRKWLWLLLIGLAAVALSITVGNGIRFQYKIGLFFNLYTSLIRYSDGGATLRLLVPVGAVVYAIQRKKLFRDYEESRQQTQVQQIQPPEETLEEDACGIEEAPPVKTE